MTSVDEIVTALLYEGYVLWPYRRSAYKNQRRWTFGGVYPRACAEANANGDRWYIQTQCLVLGAAPVVDVRVRFLQVVERRVAERRADNSLAFVDELHVGDRRYLTWDEAREREVLVTSVELEQLQPLHIPIAIAAGEEHEVVTGGALARSWRAMQGVVDIGVELVRPGVFKLNATISNTLEWHGTEREEAVRHTFVSTHTILTVRDGAFVSLMDPPVELQSLAAACENLGTWPVLAGQEGDQHTLLSSPIVLYDYPRTAPESGGDLFDASEIVQLLSLNILTLTDEEKQELRATDPRARDLLQRTEALSADDFMRLHGTFREPHAQLQQSLIADPFAALERPAPNSIGIVGVEISSGSHVRLRPRRGGDVMDLALDGQVAIVEAIEQDYDGRIHLAVTLLEDPGSDLGRARMIGHRFFFTPEEVEPLR